MKNKPGVYMVLNLVTNARYVGSTSRNLASRWSEHKSLLRKNKSGNPDLQKAWNKDGAARFVFVILEYSPENHFEREQYWMDLFKQQGLKLYNRTPEAKTHRGMKMPEGFGEKVRQAQKGSKHKMTPQGIANIRKATSRPRLDVSEQFSKDWPPLVAPDGTIHTVHNLLQFCLKHDLDISALRKVALGLRPSHKGWRKHHAPRYLTKHQGNV